MTENVGAQDNNSVVYSFTCEGCEAAGELTVPAESGFDMNCPEGCGARYIQLGSLVQGWRLVCVVKPVFVRTEEQHEEDLCLCGDYRRDHVDGNGRCLMPNDATHGFKPCTEFRLDIPFSVHQGTC